MTRPTFLVIGAMKSGTGALYQYLRQHPEVFMPRTRSPHYFAFDGRRHGFGGPPSTLDEAIVDRAEYERLFDPGARWPARGEASWSSMYVPEAPERIERELSDIRLIAILRQPAERAFSGYLHLRLYGREPARDFAQALALEPQRIREDWPFPWRYRDLGYYGAQLARFYARFGRERMLVLLQEDLRRDTVGVMRTVYSFLGVDPSFAPDVSLRPNATGVPRGRLVGAIARSSGGVRRAVRRVLPPGLHARLRSRVTGAVLRRPSLDPAIRAELTAGYREDIAHLGKLIGRDLSHWLAPS